MQIFLDKIKKPRNRKPRNGKPRKTRDYCSPLALIVKLSFVYDSTTILCELWSLVYSVIIAIFFLSLLQISLGPVILSGIFQMSGWFSCPAYVKLLLQF